MCRYIVREKRAHMEGYAKQTHSFLDKLNTLERGHDTSSINLYTGDDNDEDEFLRNSGMARNTYCSLHKRVTESLAESPPVTAQAAAKVCSWFICTPSLQLVVTRLLGLALGTRQDTLVLFIVLRLGHLHRSLLLSNLLLGQPLWSFRPQLTRCQMLELLGLYLFEHVGVFLEIEEHTEQTLLVPPPEHTVFP